jgi:hypothetical protein
VATDGGGSIRRPASHTGLLGFKPSTGRVARRDGFPQILFGGLYGLHGTQVIGCMHGFSFSRCSKELSRLGKALFIRLSSKGCVLPVGLRLSGKCLLQKLLCFGQIQSLLFNSSC